MAVLNVRPSSPVSYSQNGRVMNGKLFRKIMATEMATLQNLFDSVIIQLTRVHSFASNLGAMANCVIRILFFGAPPKIREHIVGGGAVAMARIVLRAGSRADKRLKNKSMDSPHLSPVVTGQINGGIVVKKDRNANPLSHKTGGTPFRIDTTFYTANSAIIAYLVSAFVTNNRKPLLVHNQSPITKAPWKSVWRQHGILMFRSYPSHTEQLYA